MKKNFLYIVVCLLQILFVSCNKTDKEITLPTSKENILVYVTIPPQKSIVEAIGGKYVDIKVMIPSNMDPHDYQPNPQQILNLAKANAYFEIGLQFEKVLVKKLKAMNSKVQFFNMEKNIIPIVNNINGVKVTDPHIWLSPKGLKQIAKNTSEYLTKLMPEHKMYFEDNYKKYITRINSTYLKLKKILSPYNGKTFFVFHPAFGYFARDFGLKQQAVEIDGLTPPAKALLLLITKAKTMGVKIIFVEPQFSKKTAKSLANEINGSVISINPLSENIISNFQNITNKLEYSFSLEKN